MSNRLLMYLFLLAVLLSISACTSIVLIDLEYAPSDVITEDSQDTRVQQ